MKEFISRTHLQNYTSLFGVQPADRTHSHLEKIMKITEDIKFLKDISAKRGSDRIHWECCRLMTLEIYQEGECVINFGEVGDSFYIIIEGNASILVPSKMIKRKDTTRENITKSIQRQSTFRINHEDEAENKEIFEEIRSFKRGGTILDFDFLEKIGEIEEVKEIKVLTRGDSFGEVALLSNKPRSATVRCNTLSCFAVLSRKDYKKILSSDAELSVKEKTEYLKHLPIFKHESPGMLRNLSYFITESTFKKNQIVYTEGSSPESIFFIKSGDFKFTVKQQLSTSKNYTSSTLLKLSMLKKNTKTIDLQVVIKGKNQIFGHEEIAEDRLLRVHTCVCESVFGILYVIEINDLKNRAGIKDIIGLLKCKNQDESEKNSNRLSSLKEIEQLKMANKKRIENTSSHLEIRDLLCKMGQRPNPLYYLLPELPLKSPINVSIHSKANLSAEKPKPPRKPQKKLTLDLKSIESLDDLNSYFKSVTSRFKPSEKDFSYETMPKIQKNIVKTTSVSSRENSDLHISRSQLFIKRTKSKVIFK